MSFLSCALLLLSAALPANQDPASRPASRQVPQDTRATRASETQPKEKELTQEAAARIVRERLGLEFAVTESKLRRKLIRTKTPWGFKIKDVTEDSPAARAGLKPGMIVLSFDRGAIVEVKDLAARLLDAKPGERITLIGSRYREGVSILSRHPWEDFAVEVTLPAK
jgi:S1-C subfamily serine protease